MQLSNPYRKGGSYHLVFQTLLDADGTTVAELRDVIVRRMPEKADYQAGNDIKVVLTPRKGSPEDQPDVRGHTSAKGHLYYAEKDPASRWRVFPRTPPMKPRGRDEGRGSERPRQRGIDVRVGDRQFHAQNVPELCEAALTYLIRDGHMARLPPGTIPFATSSKRYLIAREPKHQHGVDFSCAVHVGDYYIEVQKDYARACCQLAKFLAVCGVSFKELQERPT
jgi:hypothetical protein